MGIILTVVSNDRFEVSSKYWRWLLHCSNLSRAHPSGNIKTWRLVCAAVGGKLTRRSHGIAKGKDESTVDLEEVTAYSKTACPHYYHHIQCDTPTTGV
jgi:heterodisulfide reductase subunit B